MACFTRNLCHVRSVVFSQLGFWHRPDICFDPKPSTQNPEP